MNKIYLPRLVFYPLAILWMECVVKYWCFGHLGDRGLGYTLLFSIPAVKGVEFGTGFALAGMRGSQANDALRMHAGRVVTTTNHNGGVNGGITNGMPLVFRTAVKPTASIYQVQQTVDWAAKRDATLLIHGRHDPCIAHRARAVQDAVTALAVADLCAQHFGKDWQVAQAWNMG